MQKKGFRKSFSIKRKTGSGQTGFMARPIKSIIVIVVMMIVMLIMTITIIITIIIILIYT